MLPVITTIGIETAFLIGGLIVTETVFNIPGVARFLVEAIRWRDYPMVQNLVMFIALVVVVVNLHRRSGLHVRRSAHQVRRMSAASHGARPQVANDLLDDVAYLAARYPLGVAGAIIMLVFVFAAMFAGTVAPLDPFTTNPRASLAPPGGAHLMGADMMGRDVLSRMIHGARISLAVALGATILGSGFGAALGLASGYIGGWFDLIVQRADRDHAVAAAAGHGAGDHRLTRPVAAPTPSSPSPSR